jgi:excisionase family DNA binding protein
MEAPVEHLLDVPELAAVLSVKPSTIYTWVRQGRLLHFRAGRLIRFTEEHLEEFLRNNNPQGAGYGAPGAKDLARIG